MFRSSTAKRVRAIVIALVITFATNFAISYAAKPASSIGARESQIALSTSSTRSGNGNKPTILPPTERSGNGNKPTILPPQ